MKCEELLAALGDYLDGSLDPEVYESFREHLEGCCPCEVVIDNIRQTITLYKCGQTVELPCELHQHLRHLLRERWEAMFPSQEA
ncbi:MAG: zf-HC2 domain-containing protein [Pirellulales bacterium]|nr:zf-HC2 domain-containing protein [Pirellulales bacterium]